MGKEVRRPFWLIGQILSNLVIMFWFFFVLFVCSIWVVVPGADPRPRRLKSGASLA